MTIVRDGDFLGVVAPSERWRARAAAADPRATGACQPAQPSSDDHLRSPARRAMPPSGAATRAVRGAATSRARRGGGAHVRSDLSHSLHRARAARAARRGRGMERRQAHRLDRHAAAVRRPQRAGRGVPHSRGPRARDRARHGSAYGGKHTGEDAVEAARLAKAAGKPVKLVWTREEEFTWAYFRPAGVIDIKAGVDADGRLVAWEFDNWNSGNSGIRTPYDIAEPAHRVPSVEFAAAAGLVSRARGDREPLRARDAHGRDRARARRRRGGVPPAASEGRTDARGAEGRRANAPAGRSRPPAGRALGIACGTEKAATSPPPPRCRRPPDGLHGRAHRRRVRVRRDRQSRRPAQSGRGRRRPGPRRRAVRGDRVRGTARS